MIDINELRRLAQAATPGPDGVSLSWIKLLQDFQQGANPTAISELLDRLEAAEKERDALRQELDIERGRLAACGVAALGYFTDCAQEYRSASLEDVLILRARIREMERQEPVATVRINAINGNPSVDFVPGHRYLHHNDKLYLAPGAQNVLVEQDASVRKAWSRFSNELHRSPDAPYPGMSEAFEQHFSQSFTDRDWRVESGVWAAAWKAAKHHGAKGE